MDNRKGVIVGKFKREDAPVDDFGERAELIVSAKSTVNRSILGRVYEPKLNAVYRDITKRILEDMGIDPMGKLNRTIVEMKLKQSNWKAYWEDICRFGEIYNDEYVGKGYRAETSEKVILNELANILMGDRMIYMRTDNEKTNEQIVKELNKEFPNRISPVTYTDSSGKTHRTKENILVSSAYYLLLDKTGDDWAAVNSSNLQHYGLLARITNTTKYASLVRQQPSRIFGEAEIRILAAYTPAVVIAEFMDRNNNRATMEEMVDQILYADNPMDIDVIVDREKIPYGHARNIELVNHVAETHGWAFQWTPYVPNWEHYRRK